MTASFTNGVESPFIRADENENENEEEIKEERKRIIYLTLWKHSFMDTRHPTYK